MIPAVDLLRDLREIADYVRDRRDLVQASGGNASAKASDGQLYVKASGCALVDIGGDGGLATVDCGPLRRMPSPSPADLVGWTTAWMNRDANGVRPSMELSLHALLGRVVLHTHSIVTNAYLCASGGRAAIEACLSPVADTLYVEYAMPGLPLGIAIARALRRRQAEGREVPPVLLLENHGIVVHGESSREVIARHDAIIEAAARRVGVFSPFAAQPVTSYESGAIGAAVPERAVVTEVTAILDSDREGSHGALFPDAVVFCGPEPVSVSAEPAPREYASASDDYRDRWRTTPATWRVGSRFFATGRNERQATWCGEVLWAQETIRRLASPIGRPRLLSAPSVRELLQSDAEIYRQSAGVVQ